MFHFFLTIFGNIFIFTFQVYKHDHLPKKLCLSCEEKLLSFQLFVLNCHKAQETLEKLFSDCSEDITVKNENETSAHDATNSEVKPEVRLMCTYNRNFCAILYYAFRHDCAVSFAILIPFFAILLSSLLLSVCCVHEHIHLNIYAINNKYFF